MCRHIGYIGRKKNLYSILLKHKHSLIELAYKPKLMNEATLNADGFGLAWRNKESFKLYKNYLPIWNDLNLESLSKSISSTNWSKALLATSSGVGVLGDPRS